jgi:hypothetical protein
MHGDSNIKFINTRCYIIKHFNTHNHLKITIHITYFGHFSWSFIFQIQCFEGWVIFAHQNKVKFSKYLGLL